LLTFVVNISLTGKVNASLIFVATGSLTPPPEA
jgi:hypothetical protein